MLRMKGWEREEEGKEEDHGSGRVCLESCMTLRLSLSMEMAQGKSAGLLSVGPMLTSHLLGGTYHPFY